MHELDRERLHHPLPREARAHALLEVGILRREGHGDLVSDEGRSVRAWLRCVRLEWLGHIRARRDALSARLNAQSSGRIGWSYALRTLAAAMLALLLGRLLHLESSLWAVVSAVVVILPSHDASVTSAVLRVIANLVGAGVGVALSGLHLPAPVALAIGILLVAGLCRVLAIDAAARSGSVALVIVLVRPGSVVSSSEVRVAQVVLGCMVALAVTIVAARIEQRARARRKDS
jgi:hypothetical protein